MARSCADGSAQVVPSSGCPPLETTESSKPGTEKNSVDELGSPNSPRQEASSVENADHVSIGIDRFGRQEQQILAPLSAITPRNKSTRWVLTISRSELDGVFAGKWVIHCSCTAYIISQSDILGVGRYYYKSQDLTSEVQQVFGQVVARIVSLSLGSVLLTIYAGVTSSILVATGSSKTYRVRSLGPPGTSGHRRIHRWMDIRVLARNTANWR
ncbi:hypothetical protein DFH11DRAFT_1547697 [Phellopilus nigrolimitatus]|nr:hypothetical protein DFH11DRAFT_1547697 [Phellopilus nigrolimitatus]